MSADSSTSMTVGEGDNGSRAARRAATARSNVPRLGVVIWAESTAAVMAPIAPRYLRPPGWTFTLYERVHIARSRWSYVAERRACPPQVRVRRLVRHGAAVGEDQFPPACLLHRVLRFGDHRPLVTL